MKDNILGIGDFGAFIEHQTNQQQKANIEKCTILHSFAPTLQNPCYT